MTAMALIDGNGRLVAAEGMILSLQRQAGGALGDRLLAPQLAAIVRQAAARIDPVRRVVLVADGDRDVEVAVSAQGQEDGVALRLGAAVSRPPREPHIDPAWLPPETAPADGTPLARFQWQSDAQLRLTHLSFGDESARTADTAALLGQPITRLARLIEDEAGDLPLLQAVLDGRNHVVQPAVLRAFPGQEIELTARAQRDEHGRLTGFEGEGRSPNPLPDGPSHDALVPILRHILRDPLIRIANHADILASRAEGPLRHGYAGYATHIAHASRHLLDLVDDLAEVEALENPAVGLNRDRVDLADIARRSVGLLQVRAAEKNLRIDAPSATESVCAQADFRRVLQILVNIIGNAVRHTPEGGTIWVRTEAEGEWTHVIVADQGRGIAEEHHALVFEKFARIDPHLSSGTGLGLYISRRLARLMGGDVRLDSALGQGARFTLVLPRADCAG